MCRIITTINDINSIDDCLKLCKLFKNIIVPSYIQTPVSQENIDLSYFYRGENSIKYISQPSLFRTHDCNIEHKLINDLILTKPDEFPNYKYDMFSTLAKMQHFGLPTRLLDISRNPLVSLWFACQKSKSDNIEQDGKFIFIAGFPYLPDSNRAKMLTYFAFNEYVFYNDECNEDILCTLRDQLMQLGVILPYERNVINAKNVFNYYQSTICKDTIILPPYNNERIKMQQGAFIMFGNQSPNYKYKHNHSIDASDPMGYDYCYSISRIPYKSKITILSELNEIGINESFLFPDLEHAIMSIRNKYNI